jgi:large subunit ribosomal protein L21
MLQRFGTKKPGSSSRTESRHAEPEAKHEEPATEHAEHPTRHAEHPAKHEEPAARHAEPPAKPAKSGAKPDDLRRIQGIGPKTSSVLMDAGITTFSQLAATPVEELREIVASGGLGALVDPSSWPEQARLAEAEDWEAFQKLKDELA